jgi:hypothetical protein
MPYMNSKSVSFNTLFNNLETKKVPLTKDEFFIKVQKNIIEIKSICNNNNRKNDPIEIRELSNVTEKNFKEIKTIILKSHSLDALSKKP